MTSPRLINVPRTLLLGLTVFSTVLMGDRAKGAEDSPPRPHIVYFLADDLGWGDVGWHGSEIKTPNLDKLAAAGARLEQFYVQPVCSPPRAAFLTGRYPMRHGLQVGVVRPWAVPLPSPSGVGARPTSRRMRWRAA
jgi:Sulfatase